MQFNEYHCADYISIKITHKMPTQEVALFTKRETHARALRYNTMLHTRAQESGWWDEEGVGFIVGWSGQTSRLVRMAYISGRAVLYWCEPDVRENRRAPWVAAPTQTCMWRYTAAWLVHDDFASLRVPSDKMKKTYTPAALWDVTFVIDSFLFFFLLLNISIIK